MRKGRTALGLAQLLRQTLGLAQPLRQTQPPQHLNYLLLLFSNSALEWKRLYLNMAREVWPFYGGLLHPSLHLLSHTL